MYHMSKYLKIVTPVTSVASTTTFPPRSLQLTSQTSAIWLQETTPPPHWLYVSHSPARLVTAWLVTEIGWNRARPRIPGWWSDLLKPSVETGVIMLSSVGSLGYLVAPSVYVWVGNFEKIRLRLRFSRAKAVQVSPGLLWLRASVQPTDSSPIISLYKSVAILLKSYLMNMKRCL